MKSTTAYTPQAKLPNVVELSGKIIDLYRTLRERFRAMSSDGSRIADYRVQNLLDENMGPEIRRIH